MLSMPSATEAGRDLPLHRGAVLVFDVLIAVLGSVGTIVALNRAEVLAVGCLGLAVLGSAVRTAARWRPVDVLLLGTAMAPRCLVAAGTAVALHTSDVGRAAVLPTGLAVLLLSGLIAAEPLLGRVAGFQVPVVAHLPGIRRAQPSPDLSTAVVGAGLVASAIGLVLAAVGGSSWIWLGVCLAAAVPAAAVAVGGRTRIRESRRFAGQVGRAVADYAPEFVVYTAWPEDGSYQVTMWLPYLKRAGRRFLVITRHALPAQALAQLTDVPVVEARRISDLEALLQPSVKAAFYVNASSGNGYLVRFQHLTHVFLGHGDSDKPTSYNPTHAMFDVIFAAGPAATRRYAAHGVPIPPEKFTIVGRPQVENVARAQLPIAGIDQPVVLYAPTWRGHVQETLLHSLPVGDQIVAALLERGATVVFRPHAFSRQFPSDLAAIERIHRLLAADARVSGRAHVWGAAAETDRTILDCMNASDAMICDVSSVVTDYLFSGKPFAMVAVPAEPARFVEDYPVAKAAYVIRGDLGNLSSALDGMLGDDPLAAQRAATRVDYLGDFPPEDYAAAFVEAVRSVPSKGAAVEEDEEAAADEEPAEDDGAPKPGALRRYQPLVMNIGLDLLGTAIAAIALASALLAGPKPLTAAMVTASILASLQSVGPDVRSIAGWERLVGRFTVTRALLLSTIAVMASGSAGVPTWIAAAAVVLAIGISVEPHLAEAWGGLDLEVSGLPGINAAVKEPVSRGLVPFGTWVVILIGSLEVALSFSGWVTAGGAALLFLLIADASTRALIRARRVLSADSRVAEALGAYKPQFVVYFAAALGASYQVAMWLPYFVRIGRPFVILTRSVPVAQEMTRLVRQLGVAVPVVNRSSLRSLEEAVVPSMRAAFYVNNAVRNTHLIERRELTHVWLNHGDSEKPSSYNPVHAIYDLIFVGGQAGIDRYARHGAVIPAEKFLIVGRPQVESIGVARGPITQQPQPPIVLYAPTWQGPYADTRVYSLPLGRQIVEHLLERGVRVIFRPHPFNRRFRPCVAMIEEITRLLANDRAKNGTRHLWGAVAEERMSIEQCFNAADAMISDVSAVVSDFLYSEKPLAIVSVGRTPTELLAAVPAARAAYVLRQDLNNLEEVCTDLLWRDPLSDVRRQTKIYYLGAFDEAHYADAFLNAARGVIDGAGMAPPSDGPPVPNEAAPAAGSRASSSRPTSRFPAPR
jgi:CDP-glycerol glycerophosphotransferase (TagB/SpsB family)